MNQRLQLVLARGCVGLQLGALCLSQVSLVAAQASESPAPPTAAIVASTPDLVQIAPPPAPPTAACPPPDGTRPDPTLINTDAFVLERFSLERVYRQLLRMAHVRGPSASELFQQMWDSMDVRAKAKFDAPHCDDTSPPSLNGFPLECPRPEAVLKDTQPQSFIPVALINRFDLAPADGATCGEYRMIFGMTPFDDNNRNLIIFEAQLPNPNPRCGIDACRPVVQFWESLAAYDPSTRRGQRALADALERFYFQGLPGFEPVIAPAHYAAADGGGGYRSGEHAQPGGQIRTNMFLTGITWQLREFQLTRSCQGARRCKLQLQPAALGDNPFPRLFNPNDPAPHALAPELQAFFPSQVAALASDDVNLISMDIPARFNAGQSTSQFFTDDYEWQLANAPGSDFSNAIDAELARLGHSELSALDIAERATTQSCAGCHELAKGLPLSLDGTGTPVWPNPRPDGFVHIDERGNLSEALWCTFLPFRKGVLDGMANSAPQVCAPNAQSKQGSSPRRVVVSRRALQAIRAIEASQLTVSGKHHGPN